MAELKTQKTGASVAAFLDGIEDESKREDARAVARMLEAAVGTPPAMWGTTIVGFGERRVKYASGREIDWMLAGFSPRKADLTLYLPVYLDDLVPLLGRLGRHKTGKGCLYLRRLADVNPGVLREIIEAAVAEAR